MAMRPISRLDEYAFPEGTWDVRGWTVRTDAGDKKVGRVDDILLDAQGKIRYLDVDLGFLKKHILVPLDRAHSDREDEVVWIEGLTRDELEAIPEYALDPETLDEAYERRLDALYGGTRASTEERLVAREEHGDAELALDRMTSLEDEYQVAGDDPRGWKVVTADGRTVGRVAELLMEPARMRARFLDVAVDEDELDLEPVDRHILLPSDRVRLDRHKKAVLVSGLLAPDLAGYPQYGGLPVTRNATVEVQRVFERVTRAGSPGDDTEADRPGPRAGAEPAPDWHARTLRHFYSHAPRGRRRVAEED